MPIKLRNCSNCKRKDWKKLFFIPYRLGLRLTYALYQCLNCGLIQLHPFPSHAEMNQLYSYTDPDTHARKMSTLMKMLYAIPKGIDMIRRYVHLIHQQRQRLILQYVHSGSLLDAGCGTGEFLTLFNQSKWQLTGIEVNQHLTSGLTTLYPRIHISNRTIETYKSRSKFDAITLWHVFEHLRKPNEIIEKLGNLLKPGGWLFIEVPHGDSIVRKIFGVHWNLLMTPEHLYFWTEESLAQLLSKHGIIVKRVIYRGFVSSFLGSFVNWMQIFSVHSILAVFIGLSLFPFFLLLHIFFPRTRDNMLIISRKKPSKYGQFS